jgi:hypothetical protein
MSNLNKTQALVKSVLLHQTAQPTADALSLVPSVVRKGDADRAVSVLAERDYRSIPTMPKGSKTGDYAVPAEHQKVIGGEVCGVRWKKGYTQFYPMFTLDGTPVRRRTDDGEFTESYRLLRQAFAAGIIPVA